LYDTVTVRQLMHQPPAVISPDEAMFSVMQKFDSTNTWNLPVIDNERYTGFVSKSGVLTRYRKMLIDTTIDHE